MALTVNTKHSVIDHFLISLGTLNSTAFHCREVFRAAIAMNAYGVLLMHNQPSENMIPSEADNRITKRIVEAAAILEITSLSLVTVGSALRNPG